MKTRISIVGIVLLFCLLLTVFTGCLPNYIGFYRELSPKGTIVYNEDDSITYNGVKYINTRNYNGKIRCDYDSEHCVKIAAMPYSYLLGALSVFYGDNLESPDIISCSRGENVWLRDGMDIDEIIMTNNCVFNDSFSFRICDVITEESIPYSNELHNAEAVVDFKQFILEDYPAFSFYVDIDAIDGELYLKYFYYSDHYKITEEFEAKLEEMGFLDHLFLEF